MKVLYLYDRDKKLCRLPISHHFDFITNKEINVLDSIEFSIDMHEPVAPLIEVEGYIRTADGYFVIKEKTTDDDGNINIYASYDIEELKGNVIAEFSSNDNLGLALGRAIADTG